MARNPMMFQVPRHDEAAFEWRERPGGDPEEKQIGVDPFSLRQLSRVDIDRPLPIPSVSVDDHHLPVPSPARYASAGEESSPPQRLSAAAAAPTMWDSHLALVHETTTAHGAPGKPPRSRSCDGGETELGDDDDGFDGVLSSPERRASAPQRWGSDVPLIADARCRGGARLKGKHGGAEAPFSCCLYLPGITRRSRPPPAEATAAARASSGSAKFRGADVDVQSDPGAARESTMSLAVSLERFECRFSSRSSGLLDLDDDEASSPPYFDLPLELILGCDDDGDEADMPVHAAFMFDSAGIRKSVLKKGVGHAAAPRRPSLGRASTDTSGTGRISAARHVNFSMTSGSAAAS